MDISTIKSTDGIIYRLTKKERAWISTTTDRAAALLCIRYALVYAQKEPGWLLGECLPDVQYTSQIVENLHLGFDDVQHVFSSRMSDPAWYPESGELPLIEMSTMPDGTPCGLLIQRKSRFDDGIGRPDFWMKFNAAPNGKIISMTSGFHPSISSLDRSGIFPGIPAAKLRAEKARKPQLLPAGVPLRFLFIHSRNDPDWLSSAEAAKEALRFFNMATFDLIPLDIDPAQPDAAVWLFNKGVQALPHLHILFRDEDVLRLDGSFDGKSLMEELYVRFCPPGASEVEHGIMTKLLLDDTPGIGAAEKLLWLFYCDPGRIEEIMEAFQGDNLLAAQRAAYLLDRLSFIKKDVIQPYSAILLGISHDDKNIPKLRHVAQMMTRLNFSTASERHRAETLLLNLSWKQNDTALQVFSLKAIRHFAKTNFRLREFAGPFVYDLMCRTRNGRVVREAEITLDTIEYFEEQVHEQWNRLEANA